MLNLHGILLLFHNHLQIHPVMHVAIQVKRPRCIKWSNCLALPGIAEHQIVDHRRTWFFDRFWRVIHPHAICNDMRNSRITDEVNAASLADGNRGLGKVDLTHMHIIATTTASASTDTARDNKNCHQKEYYKSCYKLFHR